MTSYHNQGPLANQAHNQHIHGNAYFSITHPSLPSSVPSHNLGGGFHPSLQNDQENPEDDGRGLCLLSLDGVNICGLSTLFLLKSLMEAVGPADDPPRPCDHFHMISGTSTGGLMATMLGRMRMSIDQCILAYVELSAMIFARPNAYITLSNGETRAQLDTQALEQFLKLLLARHGFRDDEPFKEPPATRRCRTLVHTTSQRINQPVVLANYTNNGLKSDILDTLQVWEVAKATLAAAFFAPIDINGDTFGSGTPVTVDPIVHLYAEASAIWNCSGDQILKNIQCLVSVGTNLPLSNTYGPSLDDRTKSLRTLSNSAEQLLKRSEQYHTTFSRSNHVFEFHIPCELEDVCLKAMDVWEIDARTRSYLEGQGTHVRFKDCVAALCHQQWLEDLIQNIIRTATPAIDALNDEENLLTAEELQWLTHTKAYHTWWSARNGIFWYRSDTVAAKDTSKSVAASAVHLNAAKVSSFVGPEIGAGNAIARALYFQCDRQRYEVNFEDQFSHPLTPEGLVWSLICQCVLIGCKKEADLRANLRRLEFPYRMLMIAWIRNRRPLQLQNLLHLFTRVLQLNEMPQVLGIDNVHCLELCDVSDFLRQLRNLVEKELAQLGKRLAVIISCSSDHPCQESLAGVHSADSKTEINECLESLYFPQWNSRRSQVTNAEEGTNSWIWTHPQYQAWKQGNAAVLWIEGKPGSGKSVLAKSLVRAFQSASDKGSTVAAARDTAVTGLPNETAIIQPKLASDSLVADWFYSSRGGDIQQAHLSLLKSVVYQLLSQDKTLFDLLAPLYRAKGWLANSSNQDWDSSDIASALHIMAKNGRMVVCIIDALDEAEATSWPNEPMRQAHQQSILSEILSTSIKTAGSHLKFIVLSRPSHQIEKDFMPVQKDQRAQFKIVLDRENQGDIDVLIQRGLQSLRGALHAYDSDMEENTKKLKRYKGLRSVQKSLTESEHKAMDKIGQYLKDTANGVMLWVVLVLGQLESLAVSGTHSFDYLEQFARTLPLKLDAFYSKIIQQLLECSSESEVLQAQKTFALIAGSAALGRPLTISEMWEALAVPDDRASFPQSTADPIIMNRVRFNSWIGFRRYLRRICGPLIEVVKVEGSRSAMLPDDKDVSEAVDDIGPDDIVQLMHRTVKDFLITPKREHVFRLSEDASAEKVKAVARTYLEAGFEQHLIFPGKDDSKLAELDWHSRMKCFVEFMDNRILTRFALLILPDLKQDLVKQGHLIKLLEAVVYRVNSQDLNNVEDIIGSMFVYYPAIMRFVGTTPQNARSIYLAEAIRCACNYGLLIATANILELSAYESDKYSIGNGALLAAIEHDLPTEVKTLTASQRHQSQFMGAPDDIWPIGRKRESLHLDPFLRFAVRCGAEKLINFMFDDRDRHYARVQAVAEFAVTSQDLSLDMLEWSEQQSDSDFDNVRKFSIDIDRLVFSDDDANQIHRYFNPENEVLDLAKRREEKLALNTDILDASSVADSPESMESISFSRRDFAKEKREAGLEYTHLKDECMKAAARCREERRRQALEPDEDDLEDIRTSVKYVIEKLEWDFAKTREISSDNRKTVLSSTDSSSTGSPDRHMYIGDEGVDTGYMQEDAFMRFFNRRALAARKRNLIYRRDS